jgi:hypothetical protein
MINAARKLVQQTLLKYKATNRRSVVEINHYSFDILNAFLPLPVFVPYTAWGMSPTGLLHVLNYISTYQPKVIAEFGTGISTLYISRLIEQNNLSSQLYSVDHDSQWLQKVKTMQQQAGIRSTHFVEAPLQNGYAFKGQAIQWYDTDVVDKHIPRSEVEFLLIDAPPYQFPYARAGALLHYAAELEKGQANYCMDDAHRPAEQTILRALGSNNISYLDYAIGGKRPQPYDTTPVSLVK